MGKVGSRDCSRPGGRRRNRRTPARVRLAEMCTIQPLSFPAQRAHGEKAISEPLLRVRRRCERPFGSHNWQDISKRNHQLHKVAATLCAPGYRRHSGLVRDVQAGPKNGSLRQKTERGSWGRGGPRQVSSLFRVHSALSLASSQAGRTHERSAKEPDEKNDSRELIPFCLRSELLVPAQKVTENAKDVVH